MRAWAGVLVIGLAVGAAGGRPAPAQVEALIDVYQAGDGGYHTFRIPSLVAARSGTLLAFAEGRRLGATDAGDIDLVVKRSRDGGRSWSALLGRNTYLRNKRAAGRPLVPWRLRTACSEEVDDRGARRLSSQVSGISWTLGPQAFVVLSRQVRADMKFFEDVRNRGVAPRGCTGAASRRSVKPATGRERRDVRKTRRSTA